MAVLDAGAFAQVVAASQVRRPAAEEKSVVAADRDVLRSGAFR